MFGKPPGHRSTLVLSLQGSGSWGRPSRRNFITGRGRPSASWRHDQLSTTIKTPSLSRVQRGAPALPCNPSDRSSRPPIARAALFATSTIHPPTVRLGRRRLASPGPLRHLSVLARAYGDLLMAYSQIRSSTFCPAVPFGATLYPTSSGNAVWRERAENHVRA